jgi:NAD(P)-dependent dehydrogenase (short-subunit alcohol dehydrogenase family)
MKSDLFSLSNKVILITGAAGLLGRQHADAVAAFGGTPVLLDLQADQVGELANELNDAYGVEAVGYSCDITQEDQLKENCYELMKRFGQIDALINNAANNPKVENTSEKNFSRLENFPIDIWQADLTVGLTGAFLCAKHYGTEISSNPNGGVIINISSDLGLIAPDQRLYRKPELPEYQQPVKPVTYSVVKTGLIGLTKYLATYWADKGVRCNALCPGGVEAGQPENFLKEVNARIPMGRLAHVDEYHGALVFLLSDASAYLNGAIVPMDGGRTCW